MVLASELVRRGEIDVVLQYLDLIGRFFVVDKSPRLAESQRNFEKLQHLPWWLRWAILSGITKQQYVEYHREK
jgi:hypothetical protein